MQLLIIAALTFALCFGIDKGFTALFRSKTQHKTGLSVRLPRRYGITCVLLPVLGIAAALAGIGQKGILVVGGIVLILVGIALAVYYLTFGIYYDEDTFIVTSFGRKSREYRFRDIESQLLYQSGGNILVELFLSDGTAVSLQSAMPGAYPFLDHAFAAWCRQRKVDPKDCPFHDPANSLWFPTAQ